MSVTEKNQIMWGWLRFSLRWSRPSLALALEISASLTATCTTTKSLFFFCATLYEPPVLEDQLLMGSAMTQKQKSKVKYNN